MRTCYVDHSSRAIADLCQPGELTPFWTITRINVPPVFRGQGKASGLLERICADADTDGVKLALEVVPSGVLDREQLTAWYRRYGFRPSLRLSPYMLRQPDAPMGDQRPAYVRDLDLDRRRALAELAEFVQGVQRLRAYLNSPKFRQPSDRMGYVNVDDVLLRLDETLTAALLAGAEVKP